MTSPVSKTDSNGNSCQTLPLNTRNSSAVDDIVVEIDPHTTSEPLVQAPGDVAQYIASMASDSAHCNGLTAVGSQVPTVPPLVGIDEGALAEAKSSSSGDAPEGSCPPRIRIGPLLYNAIVEGEVQVLDDFLRQQDLHHLDGVTIGDSTVLHIAASSNRDLTWQRTTGRVDFAREVYQRNKSLMMACNRLKETPLHCVAKAGNDKMVDRLISFANEEDQAVKQTLLTARNIHGETALHEAVRVGHRHIVKKLILSEPSVTGIVDAEGVSPLYLATMMNDLDTVLLLTYLKEEPSRESCAGPRGQTALHVAVLEYPRITRALLAWNRSLATEVDDKKSSPLHYAASVGNLETVKLLLGYDENNKAAYMAEKNGLFPIHTAAKCGKSLIIKELIEKFPDSDELLDTQAGANPGFSLECTQGRNFLHLAILSGTGWVIVRIPHNHTILRMLNARDYQGNTPLHLAGEGGRYYNVRFLISMKMLYSSIINRNGLTPVDLTLKQVDRGIGFIMGRHILRCMMWTGALPSPRRADHVIDDLELPMKDIEIMRERVDSTTRHLGIISVLIATVTFAAIFTMPGGYIADDHMNRGTPILYRKYAFKAFIVADLLAFLLSMFGTTCLIYAGSSHVDINLRQGLLGFSVFFVENAGRATICAFALATYTILHQVNLPISILVCVASFGILPLSKPIYWDTILLLARPVVKRIGWRGLIEYRLGPWTSMSYILGGLLRRNFSDLIIWELFWHIFLYGLIFGLALI